jgi:muramoyltetrapeptide carboxypeptidase LdcA involved in peptidoglycan recycling
MKKNLCLFVLIFLSSVGDLSSSGHDVPTQPLLSKEKDKIAIVAPASKVEASKKVIEKATGLLQSWGLEVVLGKYVSVNSCNTLAGSDAQIAEDL